LAHGRRAGGNELSFFTKRRLQKALKANNELGRLQLGALALAIESLDLRMA